MITALVLALSSQTALASDSGIDQLRQFVKSSRTAEGNFMQQQLRAPRVNETQGQIGRAHV